MCEITADDVCKAEVKIGHGFGKGMIAVVSGFQGNLRQFYGLGIPAKFGKAACLIGRRACCGDRGQTVASIDIMFDGNSACFAESGARFHEITLLGEDSTKPNQEWNARLHAIVLAERRQCLTTERYGSVEVSIYPL